MTPQLRGTRGRSVVLSALLLLASCSHVNPYYDPTKPHHRPDGFQNVDPQAVMPRPFSDFLRWKREALFLDIPPPHRDLRPAQPDLGLIARDTNHFAVTWIGHSTALVQVGGVRVLTDPHFSERASPVQWAGPKR